MQQFSKDKNIPIRSFTGDETKNALGLNGPKAIADDIDTIIKMFDPEAKIPIQDETGEPGQAQGGIDEKNLKPSLRKRISDAYDFTKKDYLFYVSFKDDVVTEEPGLFSKVYTEYMALKNIVCNARCENTNYEALSRITSICFHELKVLGNVPFSFRFDFVFPDGKKYALIVSDPNYAECEVCLSDITIPDWAMQPNKPKYTASEVGAYSKEEVNTMQNQYVHKESYDIDMPKKADKETVEMQLYQKADRANTYTKAEVDGLVSDINVTSEALREAISKKVEETVLYEDVVNTPEWTNQPTYEGDLDAQLNTNDFYYVTLKDAQGNALPNGQFMLKDSRATNATIYSTVFSLPNFATGEETLAENYPVEFTESGKMRSAGVWKATYTLDDWNLKGSAGSVKIKAIGEFIQREDYAYFLPVFGASQRVSCYHSGHKTTMQSASTKQIIPFASLAANYKTNHFYEESVLERNGDNTFTFKRRGFLRYITNGDTTYSLIDYDTVGYGDVLTETKLSSVAIQTAAAETKGMIRNGTIIRVSEVV